MSELNQLAAFLQTNDEPASEETTGETEEMETSQPEEIEPEESEEVESQVEAETDEQDEEQDPEDWYTVKVGGEELQVTLDEALKGYQRDADYRKKTMTLAEERKAIEGEKSRIGELVQNIESFIKNETESINWEELKEENPEQYIAKQEQLQKAEQAKQQALQEQQKFYESQIQKEIKSLIDEMGGDDGWSVDQRNVDMKLANEYLVSKGFADEDIGKLVDHRLWKVIFDAAKAEKYKKTEAKVKEQIRKAPKSVKPGQKVPASERKQQTATNRIKNARNSQEGVNALTELLKLQR